jgi:O-antigen ligase
MGRYIIPPSNITAPVISFLLVNMISLFFSVNPFYGHQKFLILLNGIGFYLFVQTFTEDKKDIANIIKAIVISGILISLYGLYQRYSGFSGTNHVRIFSVFYNVNALAGFLVIVIPLGFYLTLFSEERATRIWSSISLILSISTLFFTFSRGGWLVFILISIIIVIYLAYYKVTKAKILVPATFLLFIFSLFFVYIEISGGASHVLGALFDIAESTGDRLEYWRMALGIISDYPITGSGLGGYAAMAQRYQIGSVYSRYAHNNFLQVLAELGIFGLIAYLWLITDILSKGISIIRKDRLKQTETFFLIVPIVGLLIHTILDFDWDVPAIQMAFFLLAGLISRIEGIDGKQSTEETEKLDIKSGSRFGIANIVLTLIMPILLIGILSPFVADGYFRAAKDLSEKGDLDLSINFGRKAVRFAPYSGRYHNFLAVLMRRKGDLDKGPSLYQFSLKESEKAIRFEPATALYHNEKAKTLWMLGRHTDSLSEFTRAMDLYPADISMRNDLGKAMMLISRYNSAIELLERGILIGKDYINRSHPNVRYLYDTYLLLGNAYSEKGELDKSLKTYEEILELLSRTPALYDEKGNIIDKNIIGAEAHVRTGEIYHLKGDINLAIQEFSKAYDMNGALDHLPAKIKEFMKH